MWSKGVKNIFTAPGVWDTLVFTYYPYGNAQGYFPNCHCQHGPNECAGNMAEACLMNVYNDSSVWVPLMMCMEKSGGSPMSDWQKCEAQMNPPLTKTAEVTACINGPLGVQLANDAGHATNSLQPPHQYTPWMVVNGKPIGQTGLLEAVCDVLGASKPSGCSQVTSSSSSSSSS